MISDTVLDTAVERAIVTSEQADKLRALARELAAMTSEPDDEERLRFISGFGDIFVAIGIALFLFPLGYFGDRFFAPAVGWLAVAAASWALAGFFTRRKRMSLPSIVLLIAFALPLFMTVWTLLMGAVSVFRPAATPSDAYAAGLSMALAGIVTAAAVGVHYYRFRVPITPAAGAAALIATVTGLLMTTLGADTTWIILRPVLFVCGLIVFAVAMRFDMSDPQRLTRRTDIAFWLHLLAAPLIVHPVVAVMFSGGAPAAGASWGILALFLVLAVVAVLINRRALLVSGLSYAGIAFGYLIKESGLGNEVGPFTFLVLGAFVLILSAGWHTLRDALLAKLPADISRHFPPSTVTPT